MKATKMSVSFDPVLGNAIREAAARGGGSVSGWLADAAAARLRAEALSPFLDGWEAEHGPLTAEDLDRAESELALPAMTRSNHAA
jgi:hypothetical protein